MLDDCLEEKLMLNVGYGDNPVMKVTLSVHWEMLCHDFSFTGKGYPRCRKSDLFVTKSYNKGSWSDLLIVKTLGKNQ